MKLSALSIHPMHNSVYLSSIGIVAFRLSRSTLFDGGLASCAVMMFCRTPGLAPHYTIETQKKNQRTIQSVLPVGVLFLPSFFLETAAETMANQDGMVFFSFGWCSILLQQPLLLVVGSRAWLKCYNTINMNNQ